MIRTSLGTAVALGLQQARVDVLPTTAYLMAGEKCVHDCRFCPQARSSDARADMLSRVTWPEQDQETVACRVKEARDRGTIRRVCFQVVNSREGLERARGALREIKAKSDVPVCISTVGGDLEEIAQLLAMGADRVSLPLDAATEEVFRRVKTGSWSRTMGLIEAAARAFPGRISTHLIVGLGETEEEAVRAVARLVSLDVTVGLFAFTPVRGTPMEKANPPEPGSYRRVQAARYLLAGKIVVPEQMEFSGGRLISYGLTPIQLAGALAGGDAFRTSGCPDCNRPYYNERPGGFMYNYPRPLLPEEARREIEDLLSGLVVTPSGSAALTMVQFSGDA